ncbi:UNVERIFIED_CONTAM: hypothetical protein Sangu_1866900, partial [Sesamum angustifolium]
MAGVGIEEPEQEGRLGGKGSSSNVKQGKLSRMESRLRMESIYFPPIGTMMMME